jgi:hypothetical protein
MGKRQHCFAPLSALVFLCAGALEGQQPALTAREIFYAPPAVASKPAQPDKPARTPAKSVTAKRTARPKTQTPAEPKAEREPASESASSRPVRSSSVPVVSAAYEARRPLGLRYSILKRTDDGAVEVDSTSVFRAGDRIRLRVEVNDPGYLYVINRGSSGTWKPLFPSPEVAGGDNRVDRGAAYEIPAGYVFTFDEQPGEEKLFVVFSRQPEQNLENLIYSLGESKPTAQPAPEEKKPKLLLAGNTRPIDDALVGRFRTYSRDLIIEKVDDSTPGPKKEKAVYVVNPARSSDSRVVADLTLNHK